jgi:hypothetical protein
VLFHVLTACNTKIIMSVIEYNATIYRKCYQGVLGITNRPVSLIHDTDHIENDVSPKKFYCVLAAAVTFLPSCLGGVHI